MNIRRGLLLHHRGYLAVGMDVHDQLSRALGHAGAAGGTLVIVNPGHVVGHRDGAGGAVALAKLAPDAAHRAVGLGRRPLLVVGAGQNHVHRIGHTDDHMPGAGGGALHTAGALLPVHLRHAVGVDVDGVELTHLHTGAPAQAAEGAVQGAVAGHLHGGYAVLNAHVAFELPAGPVAAGAADKGHPAFLGLDLHAHHRRDAAGLKAGAAGAGVDGSFPGQDGRRAPGAAGIAAAPAVGPRQAVQNQVQLGVRLDLEHLGGQGQDQAEGPAQDAKGQYSIEDVQSFPPPSIRGIKALRRSFAAAAAK